MNKRTLIIFTVITTLIACKQPGKNCPPVSIAAPAEEVTLLRNYIKSNGINAIEDSRGFFYSIGIAGSGAKPSSCSGVVVDYVGKLTDGHSFESAKSVDFTLDQLIAGWQEGIPMIAPGGKITLYLPPSLAYGQAGSPPDIPANANLIFDINLISTY